MAAVPPLSLGFSPPMEKPDLMRCLLKISAL
jgi:hypothetical protein